MLTSDFLKFLVLSPNFHGGKCPFLPPADAQKSSSRYLLKNKMSLKKFQVIWQPYVETKNVMQTNEKLCEVFALKIFFFPLSTKLFRVICRLCKYFYHLPSHQYLLFCLFASVRRWKNHYFKV